MTNVNGNPSMSLKCNPLCSEQKECEILSYQVNAQDVLFCHKIGNNLVSEIIAVLKVNYIFWKVIFITDDFMSTKKCDSRKFQKNNHVVNM